MSHIHQGRGRLLRTLTFSPQRKAEPYFGPPELGEITDPADIPVNAPDLDVAIRACQDWNEAQGLFFGWSEKLVAALDPAYGLIRASEGRESAALMRLRALPQFENRQRAIRNNLYLAAIYLVAKPQTESQRKLCSDHTCLLVQAVDLRIEHADFCAWAVKTTLKEAKEYVRQKRRTSKAPCAPDPALYWIEFKVGGPGTKFTKLRVPVDSATYTRARAALTSERSTGLEGMLQVMAGITTAFDSFHRDDQLPSESLPSVAMEHA